MTKYLYENDKKESATNEIQLIAFALGESEYAVDILKIKSINRMLKIAPLPNSPTFIEGVVNLRGDILPIIDLRKRFGIKNPKNDKKTRFIVFEQNSQETALIVDEVKDVLRIPRDIVEPPPEMALGNVNAKYIQGLAKLGDRLVIILDLDNLLTDEEISDLKNIDAT